MNKKVFFLFVAFSLVVLFSTTHLYAAPDLVVGHYLQEGKKLFEKKDYDLAAVEFNKVLLADPDNEEALMYLRLLGFGGESQEVIAANRERGPSVHQSDKSFNEKQVCPICLAKSKKSSQQSSDKKKKTFIKRNKKGSGKSSLVDNEQQSKLCLKCQKKQAHQKKSKTTIASRTKPGVRVKSAQAGAINAVDKIGEELRDQDIDDSVQELIAQEKAAYLAQEQSTLKTQPASKSSSQEPVKQSAAVVKVAAKAKSVQVAGKTVVDEVEEEDIDQDIDDSVQELIAQEKAAYLAQEQATLKTQPASKSSSQEPGKQSAAVVKVAAKAKSVQVAGKTVVDEVEEEDIDQDIDDSVQELIAQEKAAYLAQEQSTLKTQPASKSSSQEPGKQSAAVVKVAAKAKSAQIAGKIVVDEDEVEVEDEDVEQTSDQPVAVSAVTEDSAILTEYEQELALKKKISAEAQKAEMKIRREFAADKAKKIEQVHAKYQAKGLGKNQKVIFRDVDGDGAKEQISIAENRVIDRIQAKSDKAQQAAIRKLKKKAARKEKVLLKKLRAKMATAKKRGHSQKSGDVIKRKDQSVKVIPLDNLDQKEQDIAARFADKEASGVSKASNAEPRKLETSDMPLNSGDADVHHIGSDDPQDLIDPQRIANAQVPEKAKAIEKENVVLKKKLVQVVEMAQQDQDMIKDLEKNAQEQNNKVETLENDLVDTRKTLAVKKEALQKQGEKLKDLQLRISTMELDLHSKQFDFKDKQLEYEKKLQAIEKEFGNYKSEKAKTEEDLKEQLKILKEALTRKIAELNEAQERLIFVEDKLAKSEAAHAATIKEYEGVKKTLMDLEGRLSDMPTEMATDQMPLVEIDPQNLPEPKNQNEAAYQQWIQRQDKLVRALKEKLLWARDQMDYLGRYDIKISDQKMAALKEQLVVIKRQLTVQEDSTSKKTTDYTMMEARLKDAQQRLDMVEKILREKDEQVQELEKQLNGVLSAF